MHFMAPDQLHEPHGIPVIGYVASAPILVCDMFVGALQASVIEAYYSTEIWHVSGGRNELREICLALWC